VVRAKATGLAATNGNLKKGKKSKKSSWDPVVVESYARSQLEFCCALF
jgi:hypothetical protein